MMRDEALAALNDAAYTALKELRGTALLEPAEMAAILKVARITDRFNIPMSAGDY